MQINWFTVIAQIVNFLVLVWLMKKYLYKPILNAIDERGKKIAVELADAESKMTEAKKAQDEFQQKNDAFDLNKKKMMDEATAAAADERQKLLDAAKKEAAGVKEKLEAASKELQENLSMDISPEVIGNAEATLRALINSYLFVSVFRASTESLAAENASRAWKRCNARKKALVICWKAWARNSRVCAKV